MELFESVESYRIDTVVKDSRRFVKRNNPQRPDENREEYQDRIFWLVNDEISRRLLISGKRRPDYSKGEIKLKKKNYSQIIKKNIKNLLTY